MDFGYALNALKERLAVSRSGWNGKGMHIYLNPGCPNLTDIADPGIDPLAKPDNGGNVEQNYLPHIIMKTVQGDYVPWLASQTDILADDWDIVKS
jgi:hypothetical protein